jgi:hypothetical protein
MKAFISHCHQEHVLARAWRSLLCRAMPGAVIWHSSDQSPEGGIGLGQWRDWVRARLQDSGVILALLTPESRERPWIIWECALAAGLAEQKHIVPVTFGMAPDRLHDVFRDKQTYRGDTAEGVRALCEHLIARCPSAPNRGGAPYDIDDYMEAVQAWEQAYLKHSLFHDHFHATKCARQIEGSWHAAWTEVAHDGPETLFEMDTLEIWTTENRLRFFGQGAKGEPYPMEGVCSGDGKIAMTYWSIGEIPICGTVLLELIGGHRVMEGVWQGFTAQKLNHRLALKKGRAVLARDKNFIEDWWKSESSSALLPGWKSS